MASGPAAVMRGRTYSWGEPGGDEGRGGQGAMRKEARTGWPGVGRTPGSSHQEVGVGRGHAKRLPAPRGRLPPVWPPPNRGLGRLRACNSLDACHELFAAVCEHRRGRWTLEPRWVEPASPTHPIPPGRRRTGRPAAQCCQRPTRAAPARVRVRGGCSRAGANASMLSVVSGQALAEESRGI